MHTDKRAAIKHQAWDSKNSGLISIWSEEKKNILNKIALFFSRFIVFHLDGQNSWY